MCGVISRASSDKIERASSTEEDCLINLETPLHSVVVYSSLPQVASQTRSTVGGPLFGPFFYRRVGVARTSASPPLPFICGLKKCAPVVKAKVRGCPQFSPPGLRYHIILSYHTIVSYHTPNVTTGSEVSYRIILLMSYHTPIVTTGSEVSYRIILSHHTPIVTTGSEVSYHTINIISYPNFHHRV